MTRVSREEIEKLNVCDPNGQYKDKKLRLAEIESQREMDEVDALVEYLQVYYLDKSISFFVRIFEKNCSLNTVVFTYDEQQKSINSVVDGGSTMNTSAAKNASVKYEAFFICKYDLLDELTKSSFKKREEPEDFSRKNHFSSSSSSNSRQNNSTNSLFFSKNIFNIWHFFSIFLLIQITFNFYYI